MSTCTFFGHRNTPNNISPILYNVIIDLIKNKNVTKFYVGNQGNFDSMVRKNLKLIKQKYPFIDYAVVLAYIPTKADFLLNDFPTLIPDGIENTPPKFAITKRNIWMINHSDYVITYVSHISAGAAQFKELSEKKHKTVYNLAK